MPLHVYVCIAVCVRACVCAYVYVCNCAYVRMYVFMSIYVCVCLFSLSWNCSQVCDLCVVLIALDTKLIERNAPSPRLSN